MTKDELVETVARVICETHGRNWSTMMETGKEWWRDEARAAIAAMKKEREHEHEKKET